MNLKRGRSLGYPEWKFDLADKQPVERLLHSKTCQRVYANNSADAYISTKAAGGMRNEKWPVLVLDRPFTFRVG